MICKNCGAMLKDGASFCRECGAKIEHDTPKKKFCRECGSPIEENAKLCSNCGAKLQEITDFHQQIRDLPKASANVSNMLSDSKQEVLNEAKNQADAKNNINETEENIQFIKMVVIGVAIVLIMCLFVRFWGASSI